MTMVLMTLTMVRGEFGLDVYLDHSTIGGWLTGAMAQEMGVPAIVGPRSADTPARGMIEWARNKHEGFRGVAAGYQEKISALLREAEKAEDRGQTERARELRHVARREVRARPQLRRPVRERDVDE